jgi:hypothetical protein
VNAISGAVYATTGLESKRFENDITVLTVPSFIEIFCVVVKNAFAAGLLRLVISCI